MNGGSTAVIQKQRTQRTYMYNHGHELSGGDAGRLGGQGGGAIKGEKLGKLIA